jgi:hypothetical protein
MRKITEKKFKGHSDINELSFMTMNMSFKIDPDPHQFSMHPRPSPTSSNSCGNSRIASVFLPFLLKKPVTLRMHPTHDVTLLENPPWVPLIWIKS